MEKATVTWTVIALFVITVITVYGSREPLWRQRENFCKALPEHIQNYSKKSRFLLNIKAQDRSSFH